MRAKALLLVAEGKSFSKAGRECGGLSGDTVASWVVRFNGEGLNALIPRHGGGARPRYGPQDKESILEVARRLPQAEQEADGAQSLKSLRQLLIKQGLPAPSTYTLWRILREADVSRDNRASFAVRNSRPSSTMATRNPNEPVKKFLQE